MRRRLLDLIGRGSSIRRACTIAGVDDVTFYRWLSKDERFRDDATRSRARGIQAALDSIRRAGEQRAGASDWRATESWLHLVNAEEFASKRMDERWVAERLREQQEGLKLFVDKIVRGLDELIPDPELRHQLLIVIGTPDPDGPVKLDLDGSLNASHGATPATTIDVTPSNGHVPMLGEPA